MEDEAETVKSKFKLRQIDGPNEAAGSIAPQSPLTSVLDPQTERVIDCHKKCFYSLILRPCGSDVLRMRILGVSLSTLSMVSELSEPSIDPSPPLAPTSTDQQTICVGKSSFTVSDK
ncbi:hypothetical protein PoB_001848600 [Plakobranchus ocellatus]|uniref:Uncharacterized protein n=1 Tax=Plakobranchus ocellatus TaxID=259542 RepID=A0AAV3Z7X5_9GAST|nr:hypothetical protein PoB_001848600 [Plakobranchus ocellatus]